MSRWCHVIGAISIETFKQENDIVEFVEKELENAPKITGSERDCEVICTAPRGHNLFVGGDCTHCRFGDTLRDVVIDGKKYEGCDAPKGYICPNGEYQTKCTITLTGDLRDKDGEETRKEIELFIKYLLFDKDFCIDYISITVYDEFVGKFILEFEIKDDENSTIIMDWKEVKRER